MKEQKAVYHGNWSLTDTEWCPHHHRSAEAAERCAMRVPTGQGCEGCFRASAAPPVGIEDADGVTRPYYYTDELYYAEPYRED
jgi:hypothetical protein